MMLGTIFSQRLGGLSFVGLLHENIFSSSLRHARLLTPLLRLCFTTLAFLGRVLLLFLWCFWLLLGICLPITSWQVIARPSAVVVLAVSVAG